MEQNKVHEDQKYIEALRTNDGKLIAEIYKRFAPKVVHYIKQNSGDEAAAKDLIQEVLITIYDQAKTKNLQLTCPFDAYFFLICKRKWFTHLKKNAKTRVTNEPLMGFVSENVEDVASTTEHYESKMALFKSLFHKLGATCQKILQLSLGSYSMEEVASQLDLSYAYARKKKSLCMGQLTKWAKESSVYHQFKEY